MYKNDYHYSNTAYNKMLAKMYTKPNANNWCHKSKGKRIKIMNGKEVLDKLEELGYSRGIRTLQRYVEMGLVSKPRKFKKYKIYFEEAPYELFASLHLYTELGIPAEIVEKARKLALKFQGHVDMLGDDWLILGVASNGKLIYRDILSDFVLSFMRSFLKEKYSDDDELLDLAEIWWVMSQEVDMHRKKSLLRYHKIAKKK